MNPNEAAAEIRERLDSRMAARELALAGSRRSIRCSANAIRAVHRRDAAEARRLIDESEHALKEGRDAVFGHPEILYAGFVQDAEKEFAEARTTEAIVAGDDPPSVDDLGVGIAPYLNGLAEAIGEGRRAILDLLRRGEAPEAERILGSMEDLYAILVSMDYPDAVTGHLRRSTDVARGILERTRGDLTMSLVQRDLIEALDRHRRDTLGPR